MISGLVVFIHQNNPITPAHTEREYIEEMRGAYAIKRRREARAKFQGIYYSQVGVLHVPD